jgi:hypothetical protein
MRTLAMMGIAAMRSSSGHSRALTVTVLGLLMLPPTAASAAPDAEAFMVRAEQALSEQRYGDAAALFEQAYFSLSAKERTSALGELLVLNAVEAHEQAWLASDELEELRAASNLLRKHVAVAEVRKLPVHPEITQTRERIDGILHKLAGSTTPRREPPPPTVSESAEPRPATQPARASTDRRPRDAVAIGLLAGGSVAVAGGVAMLGVGAALPGWARRQLEERGGTGEQDRAFLDDADRTSIGLMAGGGSLAALGVVAIVVGAVRAARKGTSRTEARLRFRGAAIEMRW